MEDFNLRNYLYNNPLLEEEKKEEKPKGKKSKPKKSKEEDIKENKLRGYIRERITSILKEAETEEEDVDVDVDVEDTEDVDIDIEKEVDVEDEEIESDIEVKTSVPGESADEDAVLGLLTKAQEEAEKLGDDKLLDQIGNTITFFTRKHIVKSDETRGSSDF
jgi:hypothetical protein